MAAAIMRHVIVKKIQGSIGSISWLGLDVRI